MLVVQGGAAQLERVASVVRTIVQCERSEPDIEAMMTAGGTASSVPGGAGASPGGGEVGGADGSDEYVMPLGPHEARALDESRQLSGVMRLAGVRMSLERTDDGWTRLTIRGSSSAVENAKRRVEAIVAPADEPSSPRADGGAGGDVGTLWNDTAPASARPPNLALPHLPQGDIGSEVPSCHGLF